MRTPPPPPRWETRAALDEDRLLREWEPRIRRQARRVTGAYRLGMDYEDVCADLRMTMLIAIRRYAWAPGGEPPGAWLNTVVNRRASVLIRNSCARYRLTEATRLMWESEDEVFPVDRVLDPNPVMGDEDLERGEIDAICEALVYAIRQNVPPAVFAVLHLRYIEELTPSEIAAFAGFSPIKVSKRIAMAKARAGKFLASLGIEQWETLLTEGMREADDE